MKLFTVVGIRKSGKTGTTEALLQEITRRGKTAGTCKTIFCPTFSIDKPGSNTARHLKAGSRMVCSRAKNETAFIQSGALPLSQIAAAYRGMDYLILEGDYLSPVPRIVCAHQETDAAQRINELTFCLSGRISAKEPEFQGIRAINALTDAGALLDWIDEKVPDTEISEALDQPLPPVPGVTGDGFCQCGCHHNEHKIESQGVQVTVNGEALKLTREQLAQVLAWAGKEAAHE